MADNVAITEGSGTNIATDDVAGTHYQRMKLVDGTLDSTTAIAAGGGVEAAALRVTVASDSTGLISVAGAVAHAATDSGKPLKLGAKAEASVTSTANVSDGQRTDLYADLDGILLTKPFVPYGDIKVERVTDTAGNSTAFTTFGATASQRNYITTITVYNSSTTQGFLDLRDGTAGSVLYTIPLPALGGATINFPVPLRQPTANTALAYDVSAAITTAYISVVGFKGY
jgi:hypothetical protein